MTAASFIFDPELAVVGRARATATAEQIADEIGVQAASPAFVRAHCGPLANSILERVPAAFYAQCAYLRLYPVVDVRVHRLQPGDVPAFPGWHCDGEYRATYQSAADLTEVPDRAHLVATISTDPDGVSLTEFLADPLPVQITDPSEQDPLWAQVDRAVEAGRDRLTIRTAQDGTLTQFGARTLHRATPARTEGWRLFLRVSMWHEPCLGDGGQITRQEKVYQVSEGLDRMPSPSGTGFDGDGLLDHRQMLVLDPDPLLRIN